MNCCEGAPLPSRTGRLAFSRIYKPCKGQLSPRLFMKFWFYQVWLLVKWIMTADNPAIYGKVGRCTAMRHTGKRNLSLLQKHVLADSGRSQNETLPSSPRSLAWDQCLGHLCIPGLPPVCKQMERPTCTFWLPAVSNLHFVTGSYPDFCGQLAFSTAGLGVSVPRKTPRSIQRMLTSQNVLKNVTDPYFGVYPNTLVIFGVYL